MRISTAAEAAANNRTLIRGELGYESDTHVLKVGDGVTPWNSLAAVGGGGAALEPEDVQDLVGAMVSGNTETGIALTYDDTLGKLNAVVSSIYTDESIQDLVGAMVTGNVETGLTATYDDSAGKLDFLGPLMETTFFRTGAMTVGAGNDRIWNLSGVTRTIYHVGVGLITAPTGAAFIADVNKNGTTIFTTQASRPSIAASSFYDLSSAPDVTSWASGDYLTVDRDQVGSTVAGSDLTGSIFWR